MVLMSSALILKKSVEEAPDIMCIIMLMRYDVQLLGTMITAICR